MKKRTIGIAIAMICVLIGSMWASAGGGIMKDSSVFVEPSENTAASYARPLDQSLTGQLELLYGAGTYTGYTVYSNGTEQLVAVVRDGEKIGWHMVDAQGVIQLYDKDSHEYIFAITSNAEKITDELLEKIDENSEDTFPVYVWLRDIDTEAALSAMPATVSARAVSGDEDSVQEYIEQKREVLSEAYSSYNNDFVDSFFGDSAVEAVSTAARTNSGAQNEELPMVEFVSEYTPFCLMNLTADQIYAMVEDDRVAEIGFVPEVEYIPQASIGASSVQGDYVRDTNGYTGEGAIVGILEGSGLPDTSLPVLSGADITLNSEVTQITSDHASRVTAIICGQAVEGVTIGMAPDCKVYATYTDVQNLITVAAKQAVFMKQMEWLLSQGVHVINISMCVYSEINEYGTYSLIDRWADHVDMNHDVLIVSSAGNKHIRDNPQRYVTPVGMAYNGITVGAYNDMDTTAQDDDRMSDISCYVEVERGEDDPGPIIYHAEKPDLVAPGINITVPGISVIVDENDEDDPTKGDDGTSFAAPFVTGTVAQMIDAKPELASQPGILKAALLASAFRTLPSLEGTSIDRTYWLNDQFGAGKLDAKNAIYVIMSGNYTYEYLWGDTMSYTFTMYANASESQMRVALTWLKQSVLTGLPTGSGHEIHAALNFIDDRPIADWNLEVYDPNGNLVASSTTENGNVEIVAFDPLVTGNYTIKIIKQANVNEKEFVYLAWW